MRVFAFRLLSFGLAASIALLTAGLRRDEASSSNSIVVRFPNVTPGDRPLLLYSGERTGKCKKFEPHAATKSSTITLTQLSYNPSCVVELDVFTPQFGAFARRLSESTPTDETWIDEALTSGTIDVSLPPATQVPMTVWIVAANTGEKATATELFNRQLSSALPVLEDLGAGVTLRITARDLVPGSIEPDCDKSAVISTTPGSYDPTTLNFYYVENYLNQPYSSYAYDCWMEGHPEIAFVSWDNQNNPDAALAHEVGHALGLIHPTLVGGHTNQVTGFDEYNLMVSGGPSITNISLGQSYEMNFGTDSWLNRTGSPAPSPVVRACQNSWGTGVCPRLTLFLKGWPPP